MLKILIKKQLLGFASFFLIGKDGKYRNKGVAIGFIALMVYAFGAVGAMFWFLGETLCEPLVAQGRGWLYFAFVGLIGCGLSVIGGAFTAKSRLYEAKDNDLLLSMPIPTWAILLSRMIGLYLISLLFFGLVFVPTSIQYFLVAGVSFAAVVGCLLVLVVAPLGILGICCLIGAGLAWLTARMPFKNLFTVVGVMSFMVVWFWLYSKVNEYLAYVLANGEALGAKMKTFLFPFAQLGHASTGKPLGMLLFLVIFGGIFALAYLLMSRTYIRVATVKRGEHYARYREKKIGTSSPQKALVKKEFLRLIKSPTYLINASMGTFMMLIIGVLALVNNDLFGLTPGLVETMPMLKESMGLLVGVITLMLASSNTIAACSVSIEGESIWIGRSLPVDSWLILRAKLILHITMTAVPAALIGVLMGVVMDVVWWEILLTVAVAIVGTSLFAAMDLAANLKLPNLHWTNETVAVKQSISVMIGMFGGWGLCLATIGGYFLFGKYLPVWAYFSIWIAVFAVAVAVLSVWLKKRGTKIYDNL
ncbi:MAG: hypothetical protein E7377_03765 [Clostridiales bacterium]|nr:hypothetical protein [Clostridiales bacterium]